MLESYIFSDFSERKGIAMYKTGSVVIGVLITIMLTFNGILSRTLGDYFSVLVIHLVGILFVALLLAARKTRPRLAKTPWYFYSAGAIGIFVVIFNNLSFNRLGASVTTALGLMGQLIMSSAIDSFGLFGMDKHKFQRKKLIGMGIMFAGIVMMIAY